MSIDLTQKERPQGRSSFMLCWAQNGLELWILLELSCFETGKMEVDLEVSILELYYSVILCVCER